MLLFFCGLPSDERMPVSWIHWPFDYLIMDQTLRMKKIVYKFNVHGAGSAVIMKCRSNL